MSAQTVDDLDHLHRRIQSALAALRGARAVVEHCPSIENQRFVDLAEATLNDLLEATC